MISNQSNGEALVENRLVPPSCSTSTEDHALHLWLAETRVFFGADASLGLLLAVDMETCNILAWELRQEPTTIADIAGVLADACIEAGATVGSKVRLASELEHVGLVLNTALRRSTGTLPCTVDTTVGERRRMRSVVADINALVDAALRFELSQASDDDGPLSTVAIQHLVAQIHYWHQRRYNYRGPHCAGTGS